ncbi:Transposon TX1 uncharacterized 149 kDa protein [Linum perenne]
MLDEIDAKQTELTRLWKAEEEYWASRAGVQWARSGDRNTRFFHLSTIQRRGRNSITRLRNEQGTWIEEEREIWQHATNFYHSLFQAGKDVCDYSIMSDLPTVVNKEMNHMLDRRVEEWEVKRVVFQLGPNKSPGPDGFAGSFFHRHWEEVKVDMVREVNEFFEGGVSRGLASVTYSLDPKSSSSRDHLAV